MGAILDNAMEHDGLLLNEVALLFAGSSTPEVDEPDAPVGSWYFHSNGDVSARTQNTGSGVADDWVRIDPTAVEGAAAVALAWKFSTTTTEANPGSQRIRYNNATPASVTKIFINDTTLGNFDASTLLNLLVAGDKFYIQQANTAASFLLATIVTKTDNTGWFTFDVTIDSSGTLPGNNRDLGVFLVRQGGGGGGTPGDQAALQIRRTTNLAFTDAFVDVDLDTKDFENDPTVVEHDALTDRITLKQTGPYWITFRVDTDQPAPTGVNWQTEVRARVRVNDTGSELPGSLTNEQALEDGSLVGDSSVWPSLKAGFVYDATAGDFLTLQIQKEDTDAGTDIRAAAGRVVFTAIRMTGEKGTTGATGMPGIAGISSPLFYGDQFEDTDTSDWAVNANSEAIKDPAFSAIPVRRFDDTIEEGIGFSVAPPTGTTSLKLTLIARGETAPGAARTVGLKLYNRGIPDNAAVQAWSAGEVLADVDIPTNAFFQYDTETISLATLGVTVGEDTQFELTRIDPQAGTELVGDWNLRALQVEFL